MNTLKQTLRMLCLLLFIMLALMGVGIAGGILSNKKDQDYENEIKTELVEGTEENNEGNYFE